MSILEILFPGASKNLSLISALARTHINIRYRKSFAGFLWVVLNPLLLFAIQGYIFKNVLKIQLDNYLLFLASGLIPWCTLVISVESGIPLYYNARELLKNYAVNPLVLVSAHIVDSFIAITATFIVVIFILYFFSDFSLVRFALAFPIAYFIFFLGIWHIVAILTLINVFLRDTRFVVSFIHQFIFFLTPILYPASLLPYPLNLISIYSPYYLLIAPIRSALYVDHSVLGNSFASTIVSALLFILFLRLVLTVLTKKLNSSLYLNL
jgi:ABC-type polysaccharide/polyol phosphate export permease